MWSHAFRTITEGNAKRKLLCLTVVILSFCCIEGNYADLPSPYCNERHVIVLSDDSGVINYSSNSLNKTTNCQHWNIRGRPNSTITLSIRYIEAGSQSSDTCGAGSFLLIGPRPLQMVCSPGADPKSGIYRSQTSNVWIKFFMKGVSSAFILEYVTNTTHGCSGVLCKDRTCISPTWVCNGQFECPDASDEQNCATSNVGIVSHVPEVSLDVPAPSSESKIAERPASKPTCNYGAIWCYVVRYSKYMCLPNSYMCDSTQDCLYGEDEEKQHCSTGTQTCNLHLGDDYGWFATPNFPHVYPSNSYCSWVIHQRGSSSATTIQLRITKFLLEDMPATDYVKIYDGPDTTYQLLKTLYGNEQTMVVESSSNWMKIIFISNNRDEFQGFNITYQLKGVCLPSQSRCVGELDCFDQSAKCNGVWDCARTGYDETGCDHCHTGDYSCGMDTDQCYHPSDRCNGIARCANKADETNCSSNLCGSQNGTFLCDNKRCIYEKWTCDQRDDCGDHSDERFCTGNTRRVIIAAIGGSMICVLLLVILLGCSCKLYSLRHIDRSRSVRHETPMSRLYAELLRRRAPPPYHEAMLTSRNFDEVQQEYLQRLQSRQRGGSRRSRRSRRNRSQHSSSGAAENGDVEAGVMGATDNLPTGAGLASLPTVNEENENLNNELIDCQSSRDPLLPNDSETDSTDLESEGDSGNRRNQGHSRGENNENGDDCDDDDDEEGAENEDDEDDDDDENILDSRSLSAQWARAPAAGDDSSDDICILENDLEDGSRSVAMEMTSDLPRNHCDSESVETASASLDSVDMLDMQSTSRDGQEKLSDDENVSGSSSEEDNGNISRSSTPKPDDSHTNEMIYNTEHVLQRRCSDSSLMSANSETVSYDDVPLLPLHSSNYD